MDRKLMEAGLAARRAVLGGQFGLGGDRGDARHDEFPYLLLVWRQIMLSMLEAGQTPAPCVIFLLHSSIPEIVL